MENENSGSEQTETAQISTAPALTGESKIREKEFLDAANLKAEELSRELKSKGVHKVYPFVGYYEPTDEYITGFFKEPNRLAKMAVMDKAMLGAMSAVEEILPLVFLEEYSDKRIMSEDQTFDSLHFGFGVAVFACIEMVRNAASKKK